MLEIKEVQKSEECEMSGEARLSEKQERIKLVTQEERLDQIKQFPNSMTDTHLLKDAVQISTYKPHLNSHFLRIRPYLVGRPPQTTMHIAELNKEVKYVLDKPTFELTPEQEKNYQRSVMKAEIETKPQKKDISSEGEIKPDAIASKRRGDQSEAETVEWKGATKEVSFPKLAALVMEIVFSRLEPGELIKSAQPQSNSSTVKKLLGRIFCKISLFMPDELFNKSLGSLEKEFVMYRSIFGKLKTKSKLLMAVNNCEEEYAFEPGFIMEAADNLANQTHIWLDQEDERDEGEEEDEEEEEEEEDEGEEQQEAEQVDGDTETVVDENQNKSDLKITIPLNLPKEEAKTPISTESSKTLLNKNLSLIDNLKVEGAFLHPSFKKLALQDEMDKEFIEKASDMLFKLPDVDSNVESQLIHSYSTEGKKCYEQDWNKLLALKLVLWRGFEYLKRIGVEAQKEDTYAWIKSGIKSKSSSGRPVGNLMLDKVAMSSIHAMIQNGLLPHFDYLISKQIVAYLQSETECNRSEGWKRKFNSRYKRYVDQKNYEYFSYPIPKENQLEFLQMFKNYLLTNEKYLSYKKKALYAWLAKSAEA